MLFVFIMWLILLALLLYKQLQDSSSIILNCSVVFIGYLLLFEGIAQIEKHPFKALWFFLFVAAFTFVYMIGKRIFQLYRSSSNKINM